MLKKLFSLIAVLVLSLGSATAYADKLADILSKGVVRIIVFTDVPPFSSQNAQRELEGFDVDLAKMLATALGVKLELVPSTAANRIPYLLPDKADRLVFRFAPFLGHCPYGFAWVIESPTWSTFPAYFPDRV